MLYNCAEPCTTLSVVPLWYMVAKKKPIRKRRPARLHRGHRTARVTFTTSDGERHETRIRVRTEVERIDRIAAIRREIDELGTDEYARRKKLRTHPLDHDSAATIAAAAGIHTLGELADHYNEKYANPPEVRGQRKLGGMKSWQWARGHVSVIVAQLGRGFPLDQLTFETVRDLKMRRLRTPVRRKGWKNAKERSIANVNRMLGILRRMIKIAIRLKWMSESPFDEQTSAHERLISLAQEEERQRILSPAEERALITKFEAVEFMRSRDAVIALLDSGMRFGELATIRWQAADFKAGTLTIFAPKTERVRRIGMTPRLRAILIDRKKKSAGKDSDLIFAGLTYTVLRNDFRAARAAAGIADLRIHDLRHTRATRWIQGGLNESEVAYMLGHSKKTFTTRRYVNPDEHTIARALAADARFAKEHREARKHAVN
jgi:integrase